VLQRLIDVTILTKLAIILLMEVLTLPHHASQSRLFVKMMLLTRAAGEMFQPPHMSLGAESNLGNASDTLMIRSRPGRKSICVTACCAAPSVLLIR
jgi:hypothetical protein